MPPPTKPISKRRYSQDDLQQAMDMVRREGVSIAAAAKNFGIPKSTLQDKLSGKYAIDAKMGRPSVLTPQEEKHISDWVISIAKAGFPICKEQLVASVAKIIKELNRPNCFVDSVPGEKWLALFLNRNPQIAERVSQPLTTSRANVTEAKIRAWFVEIKNYVKEKGLESVFENPKRIFNADETAFFLCPKGNKVLAKKGEKTIHSQTGNDEKECLTVLVTANADGEIAPPMVVYPYERIPAAIANSYPDSWGLGKSETGWMTGETFFEYVTNVLHPWIIQKNIPLPVILFLDGHKSHITKHLSEFCAGNQIELIALFPNATHILQPMDVALFHPLKAEWKKHVQSWRFENGGRKMKREEFAPLLQQVLQENQKKKTAIQNGFISTGLADLDENQINYNKLLQKNPSFQSTESIEAKVKAIRGHLNYFESKIGYGKVRMFNKGDVMRRDESLYEVWCSINEELTKLQSTGRSENNTVETATNITPEPEPNTNIETTMETETPLIVEPTFEIDEPHNENQISLSPDYDAIGDDISELINSDNLLFEGQVIAEENVNDGTSTNQDALQKIAEDLDLSGNGNVLVVTADVHQAPVDTSDPEPGPSHLITPIKITNSSKDDIPSPFKRCLFWPAEQQNSSTKKKRKVDKIPTVITSQQFKEYLKKKEEIKKEKDIEKEIRRQQREMKKETNAKKKNKKEERSPTSSDSEDDPRPLTPTPPTAEELKCLNVNSWVVVPYEVYNEKQYFVGQIKSLKEDKAAIKFLTKKGSKYMWPEENDIDNDVPLTEICQILMPPSVERRGYFTFQESILS